MKIDDDIWSVVREHAWKWQARDKVVGILWHATRSGLANRTAAQEYGSTLNWFRSPNNVVLDKNGNPWYGGMSNYVIGGGKLAVAVPEEYSPRFSAGTHDFVAISVEVGQARNSDAYDQRDIELCHGLAADLSTKYRFKLGKLPFVDGSNNQWPGEVGHEDTAQGRSQGKSDPGPLFWSAYLASRKEVLSVEAMERIARLERLLGANGLDSDGDGEPDLFGEEALAYADDAQRQWSAFLGLAIARKDIAQLSIPQLPAEPIDIETLKKLIDIAAMNHTHSVGKGVKG